MVQITTFTPEHTEGVVSVILPIQQSEFGIPISLEDQPDLLDIPNFYQQRKGNFWIALEFGEVVGTLALLDIGDGQAALRKMFVRPSHRGAEHGVARGLLEALLSWCRANQVRDVFLGTTAKYLAAHRFYEKHGFAEIAKAALPPTFPIMAVDTKFYHRTVAPSA